MLVAGRLGDLVGRRRVFLAGIALFTLASVACGLADSQALLIAARFVQGIGGAVAFSVMIALIVSEFPRRGRARQGDERLHVRRGRRRLGRPAARRRARRSRVDWHWIFFINLPIGDRDAAARRAPTSTSARRSACSGGVDVLGSVLVTVALMLGVYAIVGSRRPRLGLGAHARLGRRVALALLAAFLALESRIANPILPLADLPRAAAWPAPRSCAALVMAGMFSVFFFGTLYLEQVRGSARSGRASAFLPMTLTVGALSLGPVARLVVRFGPRRGARSAGLRR